MLLDTEKEDLDKDICIDATSGNENHGSSQGAETARRPSEHAGSTRQINELIRGVHKETVETVKQMEPVSKVFGRNWLKAARSLTTRRGVES